MDWCERHFPRWMPKAAIDAPAAHHEKATALPAGKGVPDLAGTPAKVRDAGSRPTDEADKCLQLERRSTTGAARSLCEHAPVFGMPCRAAASCCVL